MSFSASATLTRSAGVRPPARTNRRKTRGRTRRPVLARRARAPARERAAHPCRHGPQRTAEREALRQPAVGVGLSHSGDFAVTACGPGMIGIDLERNRPMGPCLASLLAFDDVWRAGGRTTCYGPCHCPCAGRARRPSSSISVSASGSIHERYGSPAGGLTTASPGPPVMHWRPIRPCSERGVENWAYSDLDGYCPALAWRWDHEP